MGAHFYSERRQTVVYTPLRSLYKSNVQCIHLLSPFIDCWDWVRAVKHALNNVYQCVYVCELCVVGFHIQKQTMQGRVHTYCTYKGIHLHCKHFITDQRLSSCQRGHEGQRDCARHKHICHFLQIETRQSHINTEQLIQINTHKHNSATLSTHQHTWICCILSP